MLSYHPSFPPTFSFSIFQTPVKQKNQHFLLLFDCSVSLPLYIWVILLFLSHLLFLYYTHYCKNSASPPTIVLCLFFRILELSSSFFSVTFSLSIFRTRKKFCISSFMLLFYASSIVVSLTYSPLFLSPFLYFSHCRKKKKKKSAFPLLYHCSMFLPSYPWLILLFFSHLFFLYFSHSCKKIIKLRISSKSGSARLSPRASHSLIFCLSYPCPCPFFARTYRSFTCPGPPILTCLPEFTTSQPPPRIPTTIYHMTTASPPPPTHHLPLSPPPQATTLPPELTSHYYCHNLPPDFTTTISTNTYHYHNHNLLQQNSPPTTTTYY